MGKEVQGVLTVCRIKLLKESEKKAVIGKWLDKDQEKEGGLK